MASINAKPNRKNRKSTASSSRSRPSRQTTTVQIDLVTDAFISDLMRRLDIKAKGALIRRAITLLRIAQQAEENGKRLAIVPDELHDSRLHQVVLV